MTHSATITIAFTDYWLSSTGGSGKGDHDIVCYRDADGCPALPMTQVKGMLRETAKRIYSDREVDEWFGEWAKEDSAAPCAEGKLRFSGDARLPAGERAWFRKKENRDIRAALFSRLRSTAITETGVAKTDSLRTAEVAIPLTLTGKINWVDSGEAPQEIIDTLCKLTFAFGHGKNDGLGRAIASCSVFTQEESVPFDVNGKRLVIDLTPEDMAVFSRTNANQGQQLSHAGPTGASLWGWAIGQLKDDAAALKALLSGRITFSDAAPLFDAATPTFMRPAVLFSPKQAKDNENSALDKDKVFNPAALHIGMANYIVAHGEDRQAQSFGACHMSLALDCIAPVGKGHRLRSAHKDGKAEDAKLFGYQHLAQRITGYRAVIDGAGVDAKIWAELVKAFQHRLFLGKARNNGYGGGYTVAAASAADFVPAQTIPKDATIARIWCLSDLALYDDWGTLKVEPVASDFGLPCEWKLCRTETSVTTRRYAPWDSAIQGHEREITVVEAGSVFTFKGSALAAKIALAERFGDYGERGCGWIALVPEKMPDNPRLGSERAQNTVADASTETTLTKWAANRVKQRDTGALDRWVRSAQAAIYDIDIKKLPSKRQWNLVKLDGIEAALNGAAWEDRRIANQSLKDWLIAQAGNQKGWEEAHKKEARKRLVDYAKRKASSGGRDRE